MSDLPQILQQTNVVGPGNASLPVPPWVRFYKMALNIGVFVTIPVLAVCATGWDWLAFGFTNEIAVVAALVTTLSAGLLIAFLKSKIANRLLNLRKNGQALVFGGFSSLHQPLILFALLLGLIMALAMAIGHAASTFPLPSHRERLTIRTQPPQPIESLIPLYFWDYGAMLPPELLDELELLIPYEKGPPRKLLSKVYFSNPATHVVELELHGKRPRFYQDNEVNPIFDSAVLAPRDWPLVWQLMHEAKVSAKNKALYLFTIEQRESTIGEKTRAIGRPWSDKPADDASSGHFFFWGPDGGVFQVKCPAPCRASRMLSLTRFAPDPKGSLPNRIDWTKRKIKELLAAIPPVEPKARLKHEAILAIYIASLLTLDPRDPEAFFHLGKLARNRETVLAALKYGRDLGLEPAKLAELQQTADNLNR